MNKKIISALAPLKIPVAYMEYKGKETTYVMFQTYNEQDANYQDDEATAEISYVTLSFWYKDPANQGKAKEIKRLMKQAGFIFDGAKDLIAEGLYGKSLDFIYKEYI